MRVRCLGRTCVAFLVSNYQAPIGRGGQMTGFLGDRAISLEICSLTNVYAVGAHILPLPDKPICEDSSRLVREPARVRLYSHRALPTCAVSSWESEELDERPHALLLTAARK